MKGPSFYGRSFFSIKKDEDLVRENISRILLTSPGERPMLPEFGCKLRDYLFEQPTILVQEVEQEIFRAITRWEPRVIVNAVEIELVERDRARVHVNITIRENLEQFDMDTIIRF